MCPGLDGERPWAGAPRSPDPKAPMCSDSPPLPDGERRGAGHPTGRCGCGTAFHEGQVSVNTADVAAVLRRRRDPRSLRHASIRTLAGPSSARCMRGMLARGRCNLACGLRPRTRPRPYQQSPEFGVGPRAGRGWPRTSVGSSSWGAGLRPWPRGQGTAAHHAAARTARRSPTGGAAAPQACVPRPPPRASSTARRIAKPNANASAEPWLFTTIPRRPSSVAPL